MGSCKDVKDDCLIDYFASASFPMELNSALETPTKEETNLLSKEACEEIDEGNGCACINRDSLKLYQENSSYEDKAIKGRRPQIEDDWMKEESAEAETERWKSAQPQGPQAYPTDDFIAALPILHQRLELGILDEQTILDLARCYHGIGDDWQLIFFLEGDIRHQLSPSTNAYLACLLAAAYSNIDRRTDALKVLDRFRVYDNPLVNAMIFYISGDFSNAIRNLNAYLLNDPNDCIIYNWLGAAYCRLDLGKQTAIQYFEKARSLNTAYARALTNLAILRYSMNGECRGDEVDLLSKVVNMLESVKGIVPEAFQDAKTRLKIVAGKTDE